MVNLVCEAILPDCPMKDVEEIEKSIVTTYKKSIWSKFLKAISDFDMIQDGDKIAIGVSGGKDSLLLVKLFQELKKDKRKNFEFKAVSLNPGFRNSDLDNFKNNLDKLQGSWGNSPDDIITIRRNNNKWIIGTYVGDCEGVSNCKNGTAWNIIQKYKNNVFIVRNFYEIPSKKDKNLYFAYDTKYKKLVET